MNNQGTVLMTVADMSIIQAEVEVDETDVPNVTIGQIAKVTIDAVPDRTFKGHVAEIGNSPIQAAGTQSTTARQATNFKVIVVLDQDDTRGNQAGFLVYGRHHDGRSREGTCRADSIGDGP